MIGESRAVITGLGAITAAGQGADAVWDAAVEGKDLFTPITRFTPRSGEPMRGAQVTGFSPEPWMQPAVVRQTDLSTHFGLASARLALRDANLDLDLIDREKIGVMVGHAFGGMDYAEQQLYTQCVLGPQEVSPYQSIAWFYAAAMGQLSIQLGLHGYSKAFVSDRCSGTHAIGHALRVIQSGRADICLAGGVEAPFSPFMYRTIASGGHLGHDHYSPFSPEAAGLLLGEGACFVVLESLSHARRRGATVYAEVAGYSTTTDPGAGHGLSAAPELERCQRLALAEATLESIDHVFADGRASIEGDHTELSALSGLLRGPGQCKLTAPKAIVGELYGAGGPVQVLTAALAIRRSTWLPLTIRCGVARKTPYEPPHVTTATHHDVRSALINSRGAGGINASVVLRALPLSDA